MVLHHHFVLPELDGVDLGPCVYEQLPWAIHESRWGWTYLGIPPDRAGRMTGHDRVIALTPGHTEARVFNGPPAHATATPALARRHFDRGGGIVDVVREALARTATAETAASMDL